jgi:AcrR family transcriptional regulator
MLYTIMVYIVYLPIWIVNRYNGVMPYPAKTNAPTILAAAIDQIERDGGELSMRELAHQLELTPRALYRYYPDRAGLEAAIAAEGARRLRAALAKSAEGHTGKDALREAAIAYRVFAADNPALYAQVMRPRELAGDLYQAKEALWTLVVCIVQDAGGLPLAESAAVAVALWAFLHGFIQLELAGILGDQKPRNGFEVGLEAFLAGIVDRTG